MKAFAFALLAVFPSMALAECAPGQVELRGDFGTARFAVEIADDPAERAQGLMNRPAMPTGQGMLFVYERPQPASFWMRDTLIPLDIVFLDETGTVTRIHERAVPLDETPIPGGDEVFAVLEINGGLASAIGLDVGTQMRHPAFADAAAAWPCG